MYMYKFRKGYREMEERRGINRIEYRTKSVVVICDTQEKFMVDVKNVSPLGMGLILPKEYPNILNQDIIIVAPTMIMFANVNRVEPDADGQMIAGVHAKEFTQDVLEYLQERIG